MCLSGVGPVHPERGKVGRASVDREWLGGQTAGILPPDKGIKHEVSPDRVPDLEASSRGEAVETDMEQQERSRGRHVFVMTGGRNTGAAVDQLL